MIVESVRNPVLTAGGDINVLVKFDQLPDEVSFTASQNDTTDYGPQIYNDCIAGKYGTIGDYHGN